MKRLILMAVSILLALTLAAPMALGQVEQSSTSVRGTPEIWLQHGGNGHWKSPRVKTH